MKVHLCEWPLRTTSSSHSLLLRLSHVCLASAGFLFFWLVSLKLVMQCQNILILNMISIFQMRFFIKEMDINWLFLRTLGWLEIVYLSDMPSGRHLFFLLQNCIFNCICSLSEQIISRLFHLWIFFRCLYTAYLLNYIDLQGVEIH